MTIPVTDLIEASAESIFYTRFDDLEGPQKYEDCLSDAETLLSPGCSKLGIEIIAEFGKKGQPDAPEELASQIRGRTYEAGMCVEYNGRKCMIVCLLVNPPKGIAIDKLLNEIDRYSVKVGEVIPEDCQVSLLQLIDAEGIEFK